MSIIPFLPASNIYVNYPKWEYLWPPQPEIVLTWDRLAYYEKLGWVGQYKKNGDCAIIGVSPDAQIYCMNRHKEQFKKWCPTQHIKEFLLDTLPRSWTVLVFELMHHKTKTIKDSIYIFDLLVYQGKFLMGSTFSDRQIVLNALLPNGTETYSHYELTPKVWKAKLLTKDLVRAFKEIADPTIDEGIVIKNPKGKLQACLKESNNIDWQAKIRYAKKNYGF